MIVRSNVKALAGRASAATALPGQVRTRGGASFNPSLDLWAYRDGVTGVRIDFSRVSAFSVDMRAAFKLALVWYAQNASAWHLVNMFNVTVHFLRFCADTRPTPIDIIEATDLLNYKASLTENHAWYMTSLSGFLARWHRLALKAVTDDAAAVLQALRLKGNKKGLAVMTMDPVKGPFTQIEHEQIQSALNESFAYGLIAEGLYLLAWLFLALGQRPAQYAALKVCDISVTTVEGEVHYTLNVPRVKQRNADPRAQMKQRSLISQLGKVLYEYSLRVRQKFEDSMSDPDEAPLFPMTRPAKAWSSGYEFHHTGHSLSSSLSYMLDSLNVSSERTGGPLAISAIRFRRTFGTRAAQEGHGELVIAELLDHSDIQNVGIYVGSVPEIAARIDRAIAMHMAPLAQAFKGTLIKDESEATRGDDPSSRIVDLRIDRSMRPMGSCGQHSFCGFNAPLACYTCTNFQPWLDGPHEAVLSHLLEKRDQLLETTDQRMASINDRTILAVAQVIQMCQEARNTEDPSDD
jgi:integrase